ncbi:hypothetical protein [Nitratidesulfovibrio vulgaris]|nr:hypothetical protein [Nitratidesulfovibrio vulgaris]
MSKSNLLSTLLLRAIGVGVGPVTEYIILLIWFLIGAFTAAGFYGWS